MVSFGAGIWTGYYKGDHRLLSGILKANLIPRAFRRCGYERALGTRLVESTVKMSKMSNHRIHLLSAHPPPPFKFKRQPGYNTRSALDQSETKKANLQRL